MPINQKIISALQTIGLTDYELQAYVALNSIVSGTAAQISETSGVPRSRTYEILRRLQEKGFVEVMRGKPLKFNTVPPKEVFEKARVRIIEEMDQAESELNTIYEDRIPLLPAPIWLIQGSDKIIKKEIELVGRARDSIYVLGGLMFRNELEQLEASLNKAVKRGIAAKILVPSQVTVDNESIELSKELRNFSCETKIGPVPCLKMVIRDKTEMVQVFCKFSENSVISKTAIGVWNQYPELVETIAEIYDSIWTGVIP